MKNPLYEIRASRRVTSTTMAATTTERQEALRLRGQRIRTRARRPLRTKAISGGSGSSDSGSIETFDGVSVVQIPAHLRKTPESIVIEPVYQERPSNGEMIERVMVGSGCEKKNLHL